MHAFNLFNAAFFCLFAILNNLLAAYLAAAVFAFFNFYSALCSFFIALAISLKVFFLYGQLKGFISSTETTPSSGYITAVFLSFSASSSNLASAIFFYQILFTF